MGRSPLGGSPCLECPKPFFRTPKNDLGYGVKKQTLDEIGMTSSEFDLLDGMFGGNPVDEFDEILEDLEL